MEEKFTLFLPEIVVFLTACCVMVLGQSRHKESRDLAPWLCAFGLVASILVTLFGAGFLAQQPGRIVQLHAATPLPTLPFYGKLLVALVGLILLPLMAGSVDRDLERTGGGKLGGFDAMRSTRGEFYSFFLFSLSGVMLTASADDLIFLFLALELTSLPTYVMVALSSGGASRNRSMEAGVKYFFLGALGAAVFLYGFALIYGATGSTHFEAIAIALAGGAPSPLALLGIVLAVLGVCFKIAAVPMHFYTPDVYQGSSASVAGFLAFVPKAAGFFAIMLLCALVGWRFAGPGAHESLPSALRITLLVIAAMTMTVGNVLAILQHSVKRILAYSSIAHSGYMLVGIIAGPGPEGAPFARNGLGAVLFYLAAYGVMTIGAFAVVACLEKPRGAGEPEEADDVDDLRGLALTRPLLGWTMVLCSMGLLGLPPLLGFFGKVPLFTSGIGAREIVLVVILGLNSAIAAYYYLRFAYVCFIEAPDTQPGAARVEASEFYPARRIAGLVSMIGVVVLAFTSAPLVKLASDGARYTPPHVTSPPTTTQQPGPSPDAALSASHR